jgi:hypothetical protein
MSQIPPCDICGEGGISNISIRVVTNDYHDGPAPAQLPRMSFCRDCADDVSKYLKERAGKLKKNEEGKSPFSEPDAEELLNKLEENEQLVLETCSHGYRHEDGNLKLAITPTPSPPDELIDRISSAPRITLKRLDEEAWKEYKDRDYL